MCVKVRIGTDCCRTAGLNFCNKKSLLEHCYDAWKIKKLVNETGIESNKLASVVVTSPIAPWLLEQPEVDLNVHKEIKGMEEGINLKVYVKEYLKSMHLLISPNLQRWIKEHRNWKDRCCVLHSRN